MGNGHVAVHVLVDGDGDVHHRGRAHVPVQCSFWMHEELCLKGAKLGLSKQKGTVLYMASISSNESISCGRGPVGETRFLYQDMPSA